MAVIDTATDKVAKWVKIDGLGYGAAATKDGRWLLVALPDENKVDVIDLVVRIACALERIEDDGAGRHLLAVAIRIVSNDGDVANVRFRVTVIDVAC